MAVAHFLGVDNTRTAAALLSFTGLPHRQKLITTREGVAFVDDSQATNADASARALSCYDPLIWIPGGVAKAGGVEPPAPLFRRLRHAVLIGPAAAVLAPPPRAPARQPAPARAFIDRRTGCNHWAGEEPYDAPRRKEIEAALKDLRCDRLDADEAALLRRYRGDPDLAALLDAVRDEPGY